MIRSTKKPLFGAAAFIIIGDMGASAPIVGILPKTENSQKT